jgi:hypothetical protein
MSRHPVVRAALAALLVLGAPGSPRAEEARTLTVFWHAGDLAAAAQRISRDYTAETGVEIRWTLPPLSQDYYRRIADEFARQGAAFDLCIFDSQSMSEFASQGRVLRLDELLARSGTLSATDFDAASLRRYVEYPEGSGRLYALPMNQDAMGLVVRADLLEDPEERTAFRARTGTSSPCRERIGSSATSRSSSPVRPTGCGGSLCTAVPTTTRARARSTTSSGRSGGSSGIPTRPLLKATSTRRRRSGPSPSTRSSSPSPRPVSRTPT